MQTTFQKENITITIDTQLKMKSEVIIYCGFIINEAITNAFQHAFTNQEEGTIVIGLHEQNGQYRLTIQDNGTGYNHSAHTDTLGLVIIEALASVQLHGELNIYSDNGSKISITWREHE